MPTKKQIRLIGLLIEAVTFDGLLALADLCFRLVRSGAVINQSELAHFS